MIWARYFFNHTSLIMIKFENEFVTIRVAGLDKEGYLELIKTLLHVLGNQKEESPLTPGEIWLMTNLISEMLPDSENSTINKSIRAA
jgi:hypothetical protein